MDGSDLYAKRLKANGLEEALEQTLEQENEYQDVVLRILREQVGVPPEVIATSFAPWQGFTGGREQLLRVVRAAAGTVASGTAATGADTPAYSCGLWPDVTPNAASRATEYGNIIYLNSGLLYGVRLLAQEVTFSWADLAEGNADGERIVKAREEIDRGMRLVIAGEDIRFGGKVRAFGHPELEQARRTMIWGALTYAIAHEAGHLSRNRPFRGGWARDNREFQTYSLLDGFNHLPPPTTEQEVTGSFNSELVADTIAGIVLRRDSYIAGSYEKRRLLILGAMLVPLFQAAVWWRRAADTNDRLGWTHPLPDLRVGIVRSVLALPDKEFQTMYNTPCPPGAVPSIRTSKETDLEKELTSMSEWLENLLGIPDARTRALQRGLSDRGLNPFSLFFLYMSHGVPSP